MGVSELSLLSMVYAKCFMCMMYDCQAFELAKRAQIEIEDQIKVAYNDHTEADELADQTIEEVSNDKHVVGFHM